MSENKVYTVTQIMDLLPHRYPFLLVDRLEIVEDGEKAVGTKNVTMNEEFFQGHFPGNPIMPGVLQVEAMAQAAGATVIAANQDKVGDKKINVYFMTIDAVKFRKPVTPGDQLKIHIEKISGRGRLWKFKGECKVDGAVVSQAEFTAMISEEDK